jgi:hypothetical protein
MVAALIAKSTQVMIVAESPSSFSGKPNLLPSDCSDFKSQQNDREGVEEQDLDDSYSCSSGSSNSDNKIDQRRRRHLRQVHFAVDENGDVMKEVYSYPGVSERRSRLYSSREELRFMVNKAHTFAAEYVCKHPEWIDHLDSLLLNLELDDQEEVVRMLTESDARGLELSCSDLLQKHQEWAVQSVLGRYKQLSLRKSLRGDVDDDDDNTDELLRTRAERVGRFTRELALKFGRGDEARARQVFAEEPFLRRWLNPEA